MFRESKNYFLFFNKEGIHSFSSWLIPDIYNYVFRRYISQNHKILKPYLVSGKNKNEIYFDSKPPKHFKYYLNNLSYHFLYNLTIPTLLHYEDRSSMAHSIESRVPFLDYRLVELGLNLEPGHLVNKNTSRPLFREALSAILPEEIINRKDKLGYPTPFAKWSRTVLKDYITEILTNKSALLFEYINYDFLKDKINEHQSEKIDFSWDIWRLLSLESFLKTYRGKNPFNF
jgi:hypothetical protein